MIGKIVRNYPKLRLILPILFAVLLPVIIMTIYAINRAVRVNEIALNHEINQQISTIHKMFEREYELKLSKVKNDLKLVHAYYYRSDFKPTADSIELQVINQVTNQKHKAKLATWQLDGRKIYSDTAFVNAVFHLVGGTTTIFQKTPVGYVRVETNVKTSSGQAAYGTFIPNNSPVIDSIEKGKKYIGRAYVVNAWYITAYEPLYYDNKLVGMLYAGDKEKDLEELRAKLSALQIATEGQLLILDENNESIIQSGRPVEPRVLSYIKENILSRSAGTYYLPKDISKHKRMLVLRNYAPFRLKIVALVDVKKESKDIITSQVKSAAGVALIIILIFSAFVYFINTENVRTFSQQMEKSNQSLDVVKKALRESRHDFRTLFNSSSDDILLVDFNGIIIEVNQVCCDTFERGRDQMIGRDMRELFTPKTAELLGEHLNKTRNFGRSRYEAEYMLKGDKKLPVELKSRQIIYRTRNLILTHIRDISERKELEEKMISTIIQTEENERKRFSADLHDDLGPILSTIKLYTGLIRKKKEKEAVAETVSTIEELVDNAIQTTRNISRNIRPNILQDFGLAAAIQEFCDYIIKTKSIRIHLNTQNYKITKRGIEETILYHTAKELTNNTLRYANAQNIKIDLKSYGKQVILYYKDDGIGFDLERMKKVPKGLGLNNILNKIKSIKGTVDLHSEPGKGMFLIASVNID